MTGTTIGRHRFGIVALATLLVAGAMTFAIAHKKGFSADTRLQELADNAALAGVTALAQSEGQADTARLEAADAAARYVVAARPGVTPIVAPSIDQKTISVTLTRSETGRGPSITATARYVEPGAAISSAQTAALARKRVGG